MTIHTTTYKGHNYSGPINTLGDLRAALARITDMPDDTPVLRAEDDGNEPDSYTSVRDMEITFWDGETQCDKGDEDAREALFVW
ncbi:hypothetical protein [Streptosporangium longisporum]